MKEETLRGRKVRLQPALENSMMPLLIKFPFTTTDFPVLTLNAFNFPPVKTVVLPFTIKVAPVDAKSNVPLMSALAVIVDNIFSVTLLPGTASTVSREDGITPPIQVKVVDQLPPVTVDLILLCAMAKETFASKKNNT